MLCCLVLLSPAGGIKYALHYSAYGYCIAFYRKADIAITMIKVRTISKYGKLAMKVDLVCFLLFLMLLRIEKAIAVKISTINIGNIIFKVFVIILSKLYLFSILPVMKMMMIHSNRILLSLSKYLSLPNL